MTDFDHIYPRDTCDLDEPATRGRDGEYVPLPVARPIARCPICGRKVVVHDGRLREHLPPDGWSTKKCPGSGAKVAT